MRKIMLDLETLGTDPGCVVLSIGAVEFDHEAVDPWVQADPEKQVHVRLETVTQHAVGLTTDPDTVQWWMGQDKEAQQALLDMEPVDVRQALANFADWLYEEFGEDDNGHAKVEVWCRGAGFDAPILREVYKAVALKCPWAWWNERCQRTEHKALKRLANAGPLVFKDPPRDGVHHNALDDAVHQAEVLCYYAGLVHAAMFNSGDSGTEPCQAKT